MVRVILREEIDLGIRVDPCAEDRGAGNAVDALAELMIALRERRDARKIESKSKGENRHA